jgi:hypothetical protein
MWAAFEGPVPLRCAAGPDRARSAAPRARQTAAPRAHHRPGPRGPPRPPAHRPARPRPGRRSADHRLRPAPRAARPRRLTLLPDPDTPPARPRPGRRQPANRYPSTDLAPQGTSTRIRARSPCRAAAHAQPRGTPCPSPLKTITTAQDQATTRGSRSETRAQIYERITCREILPDEPYLRALVHVQSPKKLGLNPLPLCVITGSWVLKTKS